MADSLVGNDVTEHGKINAQNKKGMIKRLFIFVLSSLFSGCNIAFFVSKDNVVRKEQGYIFISSYNEDVCFIASKIDTSLSLVENLGKHKLGKAFYLYGLFPQELNYLKIFGDTIFNSSVIVPIEIKFIETKEVNRQLRNQKKIYNEHFIKVGDTVYGYQVNIRKVRYINGYPLLSEEKKRQKVKKHED